MKLNTATVPHTAPLSLSAPLVSVHQVCGRSSLVSATLSSIQLHLGASAVFSSKNQNFKFFFPGHMHEALVG